MAREVKQRPGSSIEYGPNIKFYRANAEEIIKTLKKLPPKEGADLFIKWVKLYERDLIKFNKCPLHMPRRSFSHFFAKDEVGKNIYLEILQSKKLSTKTVIYSLYAVYNWNWLTDVPEDLQFHYLLKASKIKDVIQVITFINPENGKKTICDMRYCDLVTMLMAQHIRGLGEDPFQAIKGEAPPQESIDKKLAIATKWLIDQEQEIIKRKQILEKVVNFKEHKFKEEDISSNLNEWKRSLIKSQKVSIRNFEKFFFLYLDKVKEAPEGNKELINALKKFLIKTFSSTNPALDEPEEDVQKDLAVAKMWFADYFKKIADKYKDQGKIFKQQRCIILSSRVNSFK